MIESHRERGVDGSAWRGGTQMQSVRRAVHEIKDVVDTGIHFQQSTYLVIGLESPQLITLAVAVYLIVALTAQASVDTHAQLVFL